MLARLRHEPLDELIEMASQLRGADIPLANVRGARRGADRLVTLSPLVRPDRVYYPPSDDGTGWGIGSGWELRLIIALMRLESGSTTAIDSGFARSIIVDVPYYRDRMAYVPSDSGRLVRIVHAVIDGGTAR